MLRNFGLIFFGSVERYIRIAAACPFLWTGCGDALCVCVTGLFLIQHGIGAGVVIHFHLAVHLHVFAACGDVGE